MLRNFCLGCLLFIFSASVFVHATEKKQRDILETLSDNPILTKFTALILASGQSDFLRSRGPFTIFAPTDSAFARFTPQQWHDFLRPENQPEMQRILLYHIVNGKKMMGIDLIRTSILSSEGSPLVIEPNKLGTVRVQKAKVLKKDIRCKNGVIHEIDTLLQPPGPALDPLPPPPSAKALPVEPVKTPAQIVKPAQVTPETNLIAPAAESVSLTNSAPQTNEPGTP